MPDQRDVPFSLADLDVVYCSGCDIEIAQPLRAENARQIPGVIARDAHGLEPGPELSYAVCERGDWCYSLAVLSDELHLRLRCEQSGCDHLWSPSTSCTYPRLPGPHDRGDYSGPGTV